MIKMGTGISRTISMSNTTKIIANRKNRSEKGTRALWFGSNPHSNGDNFSRVVKAWREASTQDNVNTNTGKPMATAVEINMFNTN